MLRLAVVFMLFPFYLFAQQEGEHFWFGSLAINTTTSTSFRTNTVSGGPGNNLSGKYSLDLRLNKGKFISNNRMFYYGLTGIVTYVDGSGRNNNRASYSLGAQVGLAKYYKILPGFYGTLNNDFAYLFGPFAKSTSVKTHNFTYRFAPGLFYRINPSFALQLNIALVDVKFTYQDVSSRRSTYDFGLNILSSAPATNLNFSLFYFPYQSKKIPHK